MSKQPSLPVCVHFLMLLISQLLRRLLSLSHYTSTLPRVISPQVLFIHCPCLTTIENTGIGNVYLYGNENILDVSKGTGFLNFIQSHLSQATMLSSTPSAALIVSPKQLNLFTISNHSLFMITDSAGCPTYGSPVHFLH